MRKSLFGFVVLAIVFTGIWAVGLGAMNIAYQQGLAEDVSYGIFGKDVKEVYIPAGEKLAEKNTPYFIGSKWQTKQNYWYDPAFALGTHALNTVFGTATTISIFILAGLLCIPLSGMLFFKVLKNEGYEPQPWMWIFILGCTSLVGTNGYGNVESIIVVFALLLVLMFQAKETAVSGFLSSLLVYGILAVKFQMLGFPLVYALVKPDMRRRAMIAVVGGLFTYAALNLLLLTPSLGLAMAIEVNVERFQSIFSGGNQAVLVTSGHWANATILQFFTNVFPGSPYVNILTNVTKLVILGSWAATGLVVFRQKKVSAALSFGFASLLLVVLVFQVQLEYIGLMGAMIVFTVMQQPKTKNVLVLLFGLLAAPYNFMQYPSAVGLFMDIDFLKLEDTPLLFIAAVSLFIACMIDSLGRDSQPDAVEQSAPTPFLT